MDLRHVRRWRPSLVQYLSYHYKWYDSSILSVHTLYFTSQASFIFASFLRLDCLLLHITNFTSIALPRCLEKRDMEKNFF